MKIVFFGTPHFSAEILKDLIEKGIAVSAVVTQPDKVQGRHLKIQEPPVKKVAKKLIPSTPLFQPKRVSSEQFMSDMAQVDADIFVVVAFGQIFPKALLEMPRLGCVNVHTSLLPKYRGAAPIQRSIMEGEVETGSTIMYMVEKCDAGDILAVQKIPISPDMNAGELTQNLCDISKDLLSETLLKLDQGQIQPQAQDPEQVTFAKKVRPEDGLITWAEKAQDHYNQFRGVSPKPGAWCRVWIRGKEKRLKLIDIAPSSLEGKSSEILQCGPKKGLVVACATKALSLKRVQLEGKKELDAEDFTRGYSKDELSFSAPISSNL